MPEPTITVDAVTTDCISADLRDLVWAFAADQRAFGPRRVVVAFARPNGRLRALAHAERIDPPEMSFAACLDCVGRPGDAVVAFCDEPVEDRPPLDDLGDRFWRCETVCTHLGMQFVDWIACDAHRHRSSRLTLHPDAEWWDVH